LSQVVEISLSIQKSIWYQAESLAQYLNISQSQFVEMALEHFLESYHNPAKGPAIEPPQSHAIALRKQTTQQGDLYWVAVDGDGGVGIPHPYVIIQDNVLNDSRIRTVVGCALTSNLRRASETPGNVLLEEGEANLPKQSVVEVSKVSAIEKSQLGAYIGSLDESRMNQILAGMRFLQMSFFAR
jgi:mRNA interferase MazF